MTQLGEDYFMYLFHKSGHYGLPILVLDTKSEIYA